jgi:putative serine protease PepD
MNSPKILAGGVAAALAIGGGGVLAHGLIDGSSSAATSSNSPTSTRVVSDDSTAKSVYNGAKDAVTYIVSDTGQGQATGSGFVVSSDGLIVTNEHVVDGATKVQVKIGTSGKAQDATIVGADASRDLALLKVDASNLKTLPLGDSSTVGVGDATYAIGNPLGLDHTLTTGIVSALNRDLQSPNGATISGAIQTDAALNPGNSGGPLLDQGGKVIGVNAQIATSGNGSEGSIGIGFAIPVNTVKTFISDAKAGKLAPDASTQQDQQQQQADPFGQQQADPYGQQLTPEEQQQLQDQLQRQQADPYGQELTPEQQQQLQQQLQQQQADPNASPWGAGLGLG